MLLISRCEIWGGGTSLLRDLQNVEPRYRSIPSSGGSLPKLPRERASSDDIARMDWFGFRLFEVDCSVGIFPSIFFPSTFIFSISSSILPKRRISSSFDVFEPLAFFLGFLARSGKTQLKLERWHGAHGCLLSHLIFRCRQWVQLNDCCGGLWLDSARGPTAPTCRWD